MKLPSLAAVLWYLLVYTLGAAAATFLTIGHLPGAALTLFLCAWLLLHGFSEE